MAQRVEEATGTGRWEGRPLQAGLLRALAIAVPVAAGVVASVFFSRLVHYPRGAVAVVAWWIAVLCVSSVAIAIVERQCRRLLPLATLLKLSMVFPDKAPSRYGVALRAGTVKNLEHRIAEMHERGIDDEPSRAARQILELVAALSLHDRGTRGHAERVRAYADLLGAEMGLTQGDRDRLRWAALLHDVGKVRVPSEILNKAGAPDEDEWAIIHRHPEEGARLAGPLRHWLGEWADTIEQHHERWDGLGYPNGLRGEQICRGARIVAVADAFEVMTATRSYKRPMDVKAARLELTNAAGKQFDPAMVRAFLNISLGRMRWMTGPLAWVAQLPFLQGVPGGLGGQAAAMATRVLAGAAVFTAAVAPAASAHDGRRAPIALERAPASSTTASTPGAATPGQGAPTPPSPRAGAATPAGPATTTPNAPVAPRPATPRTPSVDAPPTTAKPPTTAPPTTVGTPNAPPVATPDSVTSGAHSPFSFDVAANDYDLDGDGLAFPITISNQNVGHANVNLQADGHTINFVPNNAGAGEYSFDYQICDTRGACSSTTVDVTLT